MIVALNTAYQGVIPSRKLLDLAESQKKIDKQKMRPLLSSVKDSSLNKSSTMMT